MMADSGAKVLVAAADLAGEIDRAAGRARRGRRRALWVVGAAPPWRGRAYEAMLGGGVAPTRRTTRSSAAASTR